MASHSTTATHDHQTDPLGLYLTVFVALIVLLLITYGVYFINFAAIGHGQLGFMNTVIALTIAFTKAMLVVIVFMHLRHSTKLTWVIASAGVIWLGIMVVFTFADYLSRPLIPIGGSGPTQPVSAITPGHESH